MLKRFSFRKPIFPLNRGFSSFSSPSFSFSSSFPMQRINHVSHQRILSSPFQESKSFILSFTLPLFSFEFSRGMAGGARKVYISHKRKRKDNRQFALMKANYEEKYRIHKRDLIDNLAATGEQSDFELQTTIDQILDPKWQQLPLKVKLGLPGAMASINKDGKKKKEGIKKKEDDKKRMEKKAEHALGRRKYQKQQAKKKQMEKKKNAAFKST